jgi:hypothetical protein
MSSSTNHDQQLKDEADLRELLLRNLARLYTYLETTEEELYETISDLYLDHYARLNSRPKHDGCVCVLPSAAILQRVEHPSGNPIIIGEAASPHHAWVVGAFANASLNAIPHLAAPPSWVFFRSDPRFSWLRQLAWPLVDI